MSINLMNATSWQTIAVLPTEITAPNILINYESSSWKLYKMR